MREPRVALQEGVDADDAAALLEAKECPYRMIFMCRSRLLGAVFGKSALAWGLSAGV
jgi:hypothetical protein